ncbi:MAG: hypothetical protein K8J31_13010 [Anaerolineae bacterium]|nr:hypothetical protein [Anaerolineae bacterium]
MRTLANKLNIEVDFQSVTALTHLGRTIDPRIPSNRFVLVAAGLGMIATGLYRLTVGLPVSQAVVGAVGAGIFTMLAWAIGRELDPDHNLSASIAAVLMIATMLTGGMPNLLLTGVVVALLRVIIRSTGLSPRITDALALIALMAVSIALDGYWVIGLVVSLTFLLDALLPESDRSTSLIFAAVALVITVALALALHLPQWLLRLEPTLAGGVIMVGLAYITVVLRDSSHLESVADSTGRPLLRSRVLAGQLIALTAALIVLMWDHLFGLIALSPVWVAMLGVVLRRLVQWIRA